MADLQKTHTLNSVLGHTVDKAMDLCRENGVVSAPTTADGVSIVPISKVTIGIAGGSAQIRGKGKERDPAGTGVNVSKTPLSLVVIENGKAKIVPAAVPYKEKKSLSDMISQGKDLLAKLKSMKKPKADEEEAIPDAEA